MTKDGKPETIQELASMGGDARAKKLSAKRLSQIASIAAKASWAKGSKRFAKSKAI